MYRELAFTVVLFVASVMWALAQAPQPPAKPVDAQALHRVILSARVGLCPQCGIQDQLRVDAIADGNGNVLEFHGYRCDQCGFALTDVQIEAVRVMRPMAADLAVWQAWAK